MNLRLAIPSPFFYLSSRFAGQGLLAFEKAGHLYGVLPKRINASLYSYRGIALLNLALRSTFPGNCFLSRI